jgi:hypothetical protein
MQTPFSPKGCTTSRSRIDQETKSDRLFGSLLDHKPTYTCPFSKCAGRMRPAGSLLSTVQLPHEPGTSSSRAKHLPFHDHSPDQQALRNFVCRVFAHAPTPTLWLPKSWFPQTPEGFVRLSSRFPKPEIWAPPTLDQWSKIRVIRQSRFLLPELRTSRFAKLEDCSPPFSWCPNSRISWDQIYGPHLPSINGYDRFVNLGFASLLVLCTSQGLEPVHLSLDPITVDPHA